MTRERATALGEVILPAPDLSATLAFFTETLGFRLSAIFPAEDPEIAVVEGYGMRLRFDRNFEGAPGRLRLTGEADTLHAPNGTVIELALPDGAGEVPPLRTEVEITEGGDWITGRAGMLYRDLVPKRAGGHLIASHIRIPDGGPVPDMVHYHKVRLQIIYCLAGWVRLVYEDQGPPFVMHAGDCVLQPPEIRHRVLEASPGLEVLEITSPAAHSTLIDHHLELPTAETAPERDFAGQRFHLHHAATASWHAWFVPGFQVRETGIMQASGNLADVSVIRCDEGCHGPRLAMVGAAQARLFFIVEGHMTLDLPTLGENRLITGSAMILPAERPCAIVDASAGLEFVEVGLY